MSTPWKDGPTLEGWTAELTVGLGLVVSAMKFEPRRAEPTRFGTPLR